MTLHSSPSDFDARLLRCLVGTKVTTFDDFNPLQQPSTESTLASAISPSEVSLPGVSPPAASPPPAISPTTDSLAPASLSTALPFPSLVPLG